MLVKDTLVYLIARGLPGIISLITLVLFTRLLSPQAYGRYTLVITGVGFGFAVLYQWLKLGLLRFYPSYRKEKENFLNTILGGYLIILGITLILGTFSLPLVSDIEIRVLTGSGILLLCLRAFHELNLELERIRRRPKRYALYSLLKSFFSLSLGLLFILLGGSAYGAIGGVFAGLLLVVSLGFIKNWFKSNPLRMNRHILAELFRYGLPLTAIFALSFVISGSDRFIIGWIISTGAAGKYAAGYDISNQMLSLILVIINLAAYPLAVKALEEEGEAAAVRQLSENFVLLWAIGLPAAVGIAMLARPLASLILGEAFREAAVSLIPWISMAALIAGMKAFYFDLSYQLGKKTTLQLWNVLVAAIMNIGLNFLWIPKYGMIGAAYATIVSYGVALVISIVLGRRAFRLPVPARDSVKVVFATSVMAMAIVILPEFSNAFLELAISITVGIFFYIVMILVTNTAGTRTNARNYIRGTDPDQSV